MKHYFIINPVAGTHDSTEYIQQEVSRIFENHYILSPRDSRSYNKNYTFSIQMCQVKSTVVSF